MRSFFAIFFILHGLVHLWYFTLSRRLVEFKPEMGWNGESWLFTTPLGDSVTRSISSIAYVVATVAFVAGGIGLLSSGTWWQPVLTVSAFFSAAVILLFWDGRTELPVQRGLIGFLINITILVFLIVFRWPASQ